MRSSDKTAYSLLSDIYGSIIYAYHSKYLNIVNVRKFVKLRQFSLLKNTSTFFKYLNSVFRISLNFDIKYEHSITLINYLSIFCCCFWWQSRGVVSISDLNFTIALKQLTCGTYFIWRVSWMFAWTCMYSWLCTQFGVIGKVMTTLTFPFPTLE